MNMPVYIYEDVDEIVAELQRIMDDIVDINHLVDNINQNIINHEDALDEIDERFEYIANNLPQVDNGRLSTINEDERTIMDDILLEETWRRDVAARMIQVAWIQYALYEWAKTCKKNEENINVQKKGRLE